MKRLLGLSLSLLLSACRSAGPPAASSAPSTTRADRPIVILVSIDGWRADYFDRFHPPALSRLAAKGVRAEGLIPQFPSKTFPNHYTLVTGLRPAHHGIVSNNMVDPALPGRFTMSAREVTKDPRWWGGEPVWNTVERQGKVAAAMFWPGSETVIKGRQATYWKPFDDAMPDHDRVAQVLEWLRLPEGKRPSLLTLYFSDVDNAGHQEGPDRNDAYSVRRAVEKVDAAVLELVEGVEGAGLSGRVNYVVVSDHGMSQLSAGRLILLDDFIDTSSVDILDSGPVLAIAPKDGNAEALYRALVDRHPTMKVYRNADIPAVYGLAGHARVPAIMAIADEGWLITSRNEEGRWKSATPFGEGGAHGYDPRSKSMHGLFIASGPGVEGGGRIVPEFENIHVYDFLCALLGLQPAPNDGDAAVTQGLLSPVKARAAAPSLPRFPADRAKDVNPDTHLVLTFPSAPVLGAAGQIRIYDAKDDRLVDVLDLSIPPGPTERADAAAQAAPYSPIPYEYAAVRATNANTVPGTPSGVSRKRLPGFQLNIIGGFSDAFHFYPVIVHGNVATIYPHNNLLEYGKSYYVQIDPGAFTGPGGFSGIAGKSGWTFSTRLSGPRPDVDRVVVSADGQGDFNTVQGAIDFIPDNSQRRVTVFVRNGDYEEIVYFRRKSNITIVGQDRERVVIHYANNEVFNPHPPDVATNEVEGTFPSRRAAFTGDTVTGIHLVNLTIKTTAKGQAEGLLLTGERNIVSRVTIVGSGDALQVNGATYFNECRIVGDGDSILGRGPAFFERCDLESKGPFMWIRNTAANHGNVFVNSRFRGLGPGTSDLARSPINRTRNYTHAEAVLIDCGLENISPAGWGTIGGDTSSVHFWEHNSTNIADGKPVDTSARHPVSRQLTAEKDAETIARYRDPSFVLGDWKPEMAPMILTQPESLEVKPGAGATLEVQAAAVPAATYQWFKGGRPMTGATGPILELKNVGAADSGRYAVTVTNSSGSAPSQSAILSVR